MIMNMHTCCNIAMYIYILYVICIYHRDHAWSVNIKITQQEKQDLIRYQILNNICK